MAKKTNGHQVISLGKKQLDTRQLCEIFKVDVEGVPTVEEQAEIGDNLKQVPDEKAEVLLKDHYGVEFEAKQIPIGSFDLAAALKSQVRNEVIISGKVAEMLAQAKLGRWPMPFGIAWRNPKTGLHEAVDMRHRLGFCMIVGVQTVTVYVVDCSAERIDAIARTINNKLHGGSKLSAEEMSRHLRYAVNRQLGGTVDDLKAIANDHGVRYETVRDIAGAMKLSEKLIVKYGWEEAVEMPESHLKILTGLDNTAAAVPLGKMAVEYRLSDDQLRQAVKAVNREEPADDAEAVAAAERQRDQLRLLADTRPLPASAADDDSSTAEQVRKGKFFRPKSHIPDAQLLSSQTYILLKTMKDRIKTASMKTLYPDPKLRETYLDLARVLYNRLGNLLAREEATVNDLKKKAKKVKADAQKTKKANKKKEANGGSP